MAEVGRQSAGLAGSGDSEECMWDLHELEPEIEDMAGIVGNCSDCCNDRLGVAEVCIEVFGSEHLVPSPCIKWHQRDVAR